MKSSVALVLRLLLVKNFVLTPYQAQQIVSKNFSLTVSLSNVYAFYNYIFTQHISFCMDRADDIDITK